MLSLPGVVQSKGNLHSTTNDSKAESSFNLPELRPARTSAKSRRWLAQSLDSFEVPRLLFDVLKVVLFTSPCLFAQNGFCSMPPDSISCFRLSLRWSRRRKSTSSPKTHPCPADIMIHSSISLRRLQARGSLHRRCNSP